MNTVNVHHVSYHILFYLILFYSVSCYVLFFYSIIYQLFSTNTVKTYNKLLKVSVRFRPCAVLSPGSLWLIGTNVWLIITSQYSTIILNDPPTYIFILLKLINNSRRKNKRNT